MSRKLGQKYGRGFKPSMAEKLSNENEYVPKTAICFNQEDTYYQESVSESDEKSPHLIETNKNVETELKNMLIKINNLEFSLINRLEQLKLKQGPMGLDGQTNTCQMLALGKVVKSVNMPLALDRKIIQLQLVVAICEPFKLLITWKQHFKECKIEPKFDNQSIIIDLDIPASNKATTFQFEMLFDESTEHTQYISQFIVVTE